MRVRLESIGCRLNTGEIEALGRRLAAGGHQLVGPGEDADLCIFNSCTDTQTASRKSRQALRQLRRGHPGCTLVATGCFAELAAADVRSLGVDLVVGNLDKDRIPELLQDRGLLLPTGSPVDNDPSPRITGERTRAFLKVQDGCDNRCTFCVVTLARGSGRSLPADRVVAEVAGLVRSGYREVVHSGVHLGSYGHDLGERRGLERLVRRVLEDTGVERLRLSSLEPWDLEPGFFELFANPRLLPHLHLPLQSGCDSTLRRMARRTDRASFASLLAAARAAVPGLAISTDVMVGFPGETDEEFSQSLAFVEQMAFSRLHVFRYSARPGTAAASMSARVPAAVSQERSRSMLALGEQLEAAFCRRLVGTTAEVLWEEAEDRTARQRFSGLTGSYVRVFCDAQDGDDLTNRITATRLVRHVPGGMEGEVVGRAR